MRPSLTAVAIVLLLPSVCPALFDEPSVRKVKLEDIEDEHLQHERRSKTIDQSPPPLSKQPAKGQPMKIYTPLTVDAAEEYHKQAPSITHHQYTTARTKHHHHRQHQRVQPLSDQPSAPEADYQQAPAYQSETIVYLPSRGSAGQHQTDDDQHQQQPPQQPSPIFFYSHDSRPQPSGGNGYQVQFVPIAQHSGSDEQPQQQQQHNSYRGPQVTVPSAEASVSVVSYSHGSAASPQPSQTVQYVTGNDVRDSNVYSLFDSDKDIEYVTPTSTYGSPFSKQHKVVGYSSQRTRPAGLPSRPSTTYGPVEQPRPVFSLQKDIEYAQREVEETGRKPAITYGPPSGIGDTPQIQYGDPDAPFRRPSSQSNQNAYAPRRPESSPQTNSFPYPPSFVSITTTRPYYEKATATPEPSYNEVSQWQAPNVMPLHLIPPQDSGYRSYSNVQPIQGPTPAPPTIETQTTPLIDFFHSRRAKSLLDSYIPSWLIARMQEEHARQLVQQQNYVLPPQPQPQQPETGYNTIAYSTHFENIYPKNFKRSIKRSLQAKTV